MSLEIMLKDCSKQEAFTMFDEVRKSITDTKRETVRIGGNLKHNDHGWYVAKIVY